MRLRENGNAARDFGNNFTYQGICKQTSLDLVLIYNNEKLDEYIDTILDVIINEKSISIVSYFEYCMKAACNLSLKLKDEFEKHMKNKNISKKKLNDHIKNMLVSPDHVLKKNGNILKTRFLIIGLEISGASAPPTLGKTTEELLGPVTKK